MNRVGIEFLSVFGLPPVHLVNLAADLDCAYISTGLVPTPYNPHNYPAWSLRDDPALRKKMIAVLHDRGVSISLGEGFSIRPGIDARDRIADLEIMCQLGVKRINTVAVDPDLNRCFDQIAKLVEMANAFAMETTLEFAPGLTVADLPAALAAIRHIGNPNLRLLVDIMHFMRSGSNITELAALDPELIGYIQLCDAPAIPSNPNYLDEAMFERLAPGTGELPLLEILAALPRDRVIGLEIPRRELAERGIGPYKRMGQCVRATNNLLSQLNT